MDELHINVSLYDKRLSAEEVRKLRDAHESDLHVATVVYSDDTTLSDALSLIDIDEPIETVK